MDKNLGFSNRKVSVHCTLSGFAILLLPAFILENAMTTNAYLFSWDCEGIEAIIPITQYERWDAENTWRLVKGEEALRNPIDSILQSLLLRARFNPQRSYEIYTVDCSPEMDEEFWHRQWEENPQFTAELIRERGHKLYSDRTERKKVIT